MIDIPWVSLTPRKRSTSLNCMNGLEPHPDAVMLLTAVSEAVEQYDPSTQAAILLEVASGHGAYSNVVRDKLKARDQAQRTQSLAPGSWPDLEVSPGWELVGAPSVEIRTRHSHSLPVTAVE